MAIARAYEETFTNLVSARIVIAHPEVMVDGDEAEAVSAITISYTDTAGRAWIVDGLARWSIVRTDDGMAIARLDHHES
jgi:hypothetical protein